MSARSNTCRWAVISLLLVITCNRAFAGKTLYVDDDAAGANNGSSWTDAYKYLQDALADANSADKPVEIRVAQGIYRPDRNTAELNGTGDRTATFQLINAVTLRGAYAGYYVNGNNGEIIDPNSRDIDLYATILSGDLDGNDVDVNDPCDLLNEPTRAENSYHIVTGNGTDNTAILDGLTITSGYASGDYLSVHSNGGGIYNYTGSPTIINCTIARNAAAGWWGSGGGMYNIMRSHPKVTNCTFSGNVATWGGGLRNQDGSSPVLVNCIFKRNSAYSGGGINQGSSTIAKLIHCNFIENSATKYSGGGISGVDTLILLNCTFIGNLSAGEGGGIAGAGTIINCIFSGNSAEGEGGGIHIPRPPQPMSGNSSSTDQQVTIITNCTIFGNTAQGGGGIYNSGGGHIPTNSIIWGNSDSNGMGESSQVYGFGIPNYCCIQGWTGTLGGVGNMGDDPFFADPNNGDYHLKSQAGRWDENEGRWTKDEVTSPCIDSGNPLSPIGYEPFPNGGVINMGAYGGTTEASKSYFGAPVCETIIAGDINGDCKVNFADFAIMAGHWLRDSNE